MIYTNGKCITVADAKDEGNLLEFMERLVTTINDEKQYKGKKVLRVESLKIDSEIPAFNKPEEVDLDFLIQSGAELRACNVGDILPKSGTFHKTVKHTFSPEENHNLSMSLANAHQEKRAIIDDKAKVMANFTMRIKEKDGTINLLSDNISNGYEMRSIECRMELDFSTSKRMYYAVGSNELVHDEPFTQDDFQLKLW